MAFTPFSKVAECEVSVQGKGTVGTNMMLDEDVSREEQNKVSVTVSQGQPERCQRTKRSMPESS